jgi:hypothetical protein
LKPDRRLSAVIRVSTEFGGAISCCNYCRAYVHCASSFGGSSSRRIVFADSDVPWYPSFGEGGTVNGVPCAAKCFLLRSISMSVIWL